MPFANEFISPEDVRKYGLEEIDTHYVVGGTRSRQWTIDRSRDLYLRNVARGGGAEPEIRNQTIWTFYRDGEALTLRLDLLEGRGGRGERGWSHWKLVWLNGSHGFPSNLKPKKEEILADLKEALVTYKDFGMYSSNTSYSVALDVDDGCVL